MRLFFFITCLLLASSSARAQTPLPRPAKADPRLEEARRLHPGCRGPVKPEHVEAAKGLHVAATHLYAEGRYELAEARWRQAYGLDCTAHRLLLNIASARERRGEAHGAWEARALYGERGGEPAGEPPAPPHRPPAFRTGIAHELISWPTTSDGTALGFVATGRLRHRALLLELELPVSWWFSGPPIGDPQGRARDGVRAGMGNPLVGAHYVVAWEEGAFRFGGRVGAPLGAIDDVDWQGASARVGQAQAFRRWARWAPETVPLGIGQALDWRLFGPLFFVAEGEAVLLLPTGRRMPLPPLGDGVELALEARGGLEIAAPIGGGAALGGGAAGQVVLFPTARGDGTQAAVDVWALYRSEAFFGRVGSLWALDAPLGLAFERGKVLTVHLEVGVPLD